jgi:hypothetical protein
MNRGSDSLASFCPPIAPPAPGRLLNRGRRRDKGQGGSLFAPSRALSRERCATERKTANVLRSPAWTAPIALKLTARLHRAGLGAQLLPPCGACGPK